MSGETTRFDRDDWRLSAYVASELDGDERAAVERLLETDAEAREFVDGLRATAGELERALGREEAPALSEAARAGVLRPPRRFAWRWAAALLLVGAAAGLGLEWMGEEPSVASFAYSLFGDDEQWRPKHRSYVGDRPVADAGEPVDSGVARQLQELGYLRGDEALGYVHGDEATQPAAFLTGMGRRGDGYRGPGDSVAPGLRDGPTAREATREEYAAVEIEDFRRTADEALSTFSIDVDTASYANVRRFLREGSLPPKGAVRVEEFVNAFTYDDPAPAGDAPFRVTTEVASCPWAPRHRLVRIGLKAKTIDWSERKPANLVFLLDVSGSMSSPDKLPLLKRSLRLLAAQLDARDRVSIVVYAGAAGLVLPPTPGSRYGEILGALERLSAGGSTNGGAGIELAYRLAEEHLVPGGLNRVILATDGDFNVGVSDQSSLVELIEEKRESGVFLTVLGFGRGNLNDATMEQLADEGNGSYGYVDSLDEAKRLLVDQIGGTMIPVAKDVKIQVELNPAAVTAWRLIGYENRRLAHQDFADDTKDAGEIGAGLSVTALYELVPAGVPYDGPAVGERRYEPAVPPSNAFAGELLFLKLRYKHPDGDTSRLIDTPVEDDPTPWTGASTDLRWAAAVAAFAELLRGSGHLGGLDLDGVREIAWGARGEDANGRRAECLELIERARTLAADD